MFCSQCGTNNKDDATFCINCGAAISAQPVQQQPAQQQPVQQQPMQQQPVQPVQPVMQPQQPGYGAQPNMQQPYVQPPVYGGQPNMQQPYVQPPVYGGQPNMQQPYGQQPVYGGQPYMQPPVMPRKKSHVGLIVGLISGVVVIAAVLLIIFVGGKKFATNLTPEGPINMIVKAMNNADGELYLKAFPEKLAESFGTVDEADEYLESLIESYKEEFGDNAKITIVIEKKTNITDEDLDTIKEDCEALDVDVDAAYEIDTTMTNKGSEKKESQDMTFTVIKVDGKWYVYNLE